MASTRTGLIGPRRTDAVSPELILVDPVLAEWARARLPDPPDALSRSTTVSTLRSLVAASAPSAPVAPAPAWGRSAPVVSPRRRRRESAALAAGVAAVAAVAVFLADVRVQVGKTPAAAKPSPVGTPPVITGNATLVPSRNASSARTPQPGAAPGPLATDLMSDPDQLAPALDPGPRRLAWAPTPQATAYHVELFKGSSLVFRADTREAKIAIPATWKIRGRQRQLVAGEYRWYVWPVISGRQASEATVRTELVVPPS